MEEDYDMPIIPDDVGDDGDIPPAMYNTGIAEMLGIHTDIPLKKMNAWYPFLNKAMQFGNMSKNDMLDIDDDLRIQNILTRSKMTRGEKIRAYDRGELICTRALLKAGIGLSKDGFLAKRLTGIYRHVETSDGIHNNAVPHKKSVFGNFFKNRGDGE